MALAASSTGTAKKRKPLTETQRNILQRERSERRLGREEHARRQQAEQEQEARYYRETSGAAQIRRQERLQTESELHRQRVQQQVATSVGSGIIGGLSQPAKPFGSLFFTVVFAMAALIIFYDIVAHPDPTSTFFNSLSGWLHALSSNQPIFQKVSKQ